MDFEKLVDSILEEVYKKLQNKKLVVLWEDSIEEYNIKLAQEYEVYSYKEGITDCDAVVVSKLCLRGLANLSNGISISNEERFILKMLMKGKKVYVLNEGVEYKKYLSTAPKALYSKYVEFEEKLKDYGVSFINSIEEIGSKVIDIVSKKVTEEVIEQKNFQQSFEIKNKKLITECDIKKLYKQGMKEVVIDKKSIITPLASDFIRIQKLNIKRV